MLARQIRSGTPPSREAAATLARMRLLLIITELDKTSRSANGPARLAERTPPGD
jgi:hypothetical protein